MICIVSGPSCSGKSTFLARAESSRLTRLPDSAPIVFPAQVCKTPDCACVPCHFHYNILRPADASRRNGGTEGLRYTDFASDRAWTMLLQSPLPKTAVVMVAGRHVLRQRMSRRRFVNEGFILGCLNPIYKRRHWLGLLEEIDVEALYRAWLAELERHAIPSILVDATCPFRSTLSPASLSTLNLNADMRENRNDQTGKSDRYLQAAVQLQPGRVCRLPRREQDG